ncbi:MULTISPECIES: DUF4276 family protein [Sorangium]|uniref:DUF4276 domain-containing protein n=1 Tax=Sorangium cellulosum TaxID=56 RepID=A0A4P2QZV0_SORCE|nr:MULTISPECIES: DUF4276 family protein [Sorangium]AUX35771.1 hypothetical protein SOCE836_079700 [Sorangium cellulosum]
MIIKFLLVCEGTSDRGLVPHLEALCVRAGADEAAGDAPDLGRLPQPPGKRIEEQARTALKLAGNVNLLFAHQDADAREPEEVRQRIHERLAGLDGCPPHVCVIPVQEIEAWLLLDEAAIRMVAGNPRGQEELNLPPRRSIESTSKPKERLEAALAAASGKKGKRVQRFKGSFSERRAMLLQRLDIEGPINELPAWQRLVTDIEAVVADLLREAPKTKGYR